MTVSYNCPCLDSLLLVIESNQTIIVMANDLLFPISYSLFLKLNTVTSALDPSLIGTPLVPIPLETYK